MVVKPKYMKNAAALLKLAEERLKSLDGMEKLKSV